MGVGVGGVTGEQSAGYADGVPVWIHRPSHMKGWEAFGVTGREPTVRRLGLVTFTRSGAPTTEERPGTEPFHPDEVIGGVSSVEIRTFADAPTGAYIYVIGTRQASVEARWRAAEGAWRTLRAELWPTHIDSSGAA